MHMVYKKIMIVEDFFQDAISDVCEAHTGEADTQKSLGALDLIT